MPETEQAWLDAADGKTVHQLEALVAGKERGDSPSSAPKPEARRHILRFEVSAETFSVFREAIDEIRRDSGGSLDDDSTLMQMARDVLGGPTDEGRSSYQVVLCVCPACRQGYQQSAGELVPVGADIVAMAECDGQHVDLSHAQVPNAEAPPCARSSSAESVGAETVEFAAHAGALGVDADTGTTDAHVGALRPAARAKQGVRPATRRAVLRRDYGRCKVPGCKNRRFVDVHHIQLRSEGGSNRASNLMTLCGHHHRATHRGKLVVSGVAPDALCFHHADGSTYGSTADPHVIEARSKVFAALRGLGFGEGDARRALAELAARKDRQSLHWGDFARGGSSADLAEKSS